MATFRTSLDEQRQHQNEMQNQVNLIKSGGYTMNPDMLRRAEDINYGREVGQEEFYNDPDMKRLRDLREQYAKGYSGEELGAIRQQARGEIAGSQQAQQRQLQSKLARGGVGGARGAAIQGAQAQQGARAVAEAERKMALDSANMQRQGAADLQDFIFRQKYGKMGTAAAMGQMGSADYAAQQAALANQQPASKGPLEEAVDYSVIGKKGIGPLAWADRLGFKF